MPNLVYDVFHFVIPNSSNTQILVTPSAEPIQSTTKYSLPHVSSPRFTCQEDLDDPEYEQAIIVGSWNGHTDFLCHSVKENLGLDLYVRDIVWYREDDSEGRENGREESVLVADLRGDTVLPSRFCWVSLEQVNDLHWVPFNSNVETPALIANVFKAKSDVTGSLNERAERDTDKPSQWSGDCELATTTQLWRRKGWIDEIERWLICALEAQSLRVTPGHRLAQERNMHYSTVLLCAVQSTDDSPSSGDIFYVYLKCSCLGSREALITKTIASHFPDIIPKILATKDDTFVQTEAADSNDVSERDIMRVLANLQIRSVDRITSLRAGGVPYRGLDWQARKIAEVLQHSALKHLQGEEFYISLSGRVNDFQTLLAELVTYNIPHTLVHGDFTYDSVRADMLQQDSVRFIDLSTACIGYPFIDFVRISEIEFDGIREKSATEIYLTAWKQYECDENITRALELTYPLLLCDNLHTILEDYEAANDVERPYRLQYLENRVKGLSQSIDMCLRDRNSNSEASEGTGVIIITKDGGRRIFAEKKNNMLSLPMVTAFGITRITDRALDGHGMRQVVKAQLGIDTRTVRELWIRAGTEQERKIAVVLEALDEGQQISPGYTWASENDVNAFKKCTRDDRLAIETFFSGMGNQDVVSMGAPWRQFGWLMRTREWLDTTLKRKGLEVVGGLHEMKTDVFSTVWKCFVRELRKDDYRERCQGVQSVFVKSSVLDLCEGRLLSVMSIFADGLIPSVIEMDPHCNMFVMRDVGPAVKDDVQLSLALKGLARLHSCSVAYIDRLREAGLPEYKCGWVKRNTKRILEDSRLVTREQEESGSALQDVDADDVIRCLGELEALDMPLTLVHGDFHKGNIGTKATDGHKIFDWGSAFIGHPLSDVAVIVRTSIYSSDEEEAAESYLPTWKDRITEASFGRALDLAFVYYWTVNMERLQQIMKKIPVADRWLVKDRILWSFRHLRRALGQVSSGNVVNKRVSE